MPRTNPSRTIGSEANVAKRVAAERRRLGLGVDALAKLMTEAGCSMRGSAIARLEQGVEDGHPARRVTVDELVAFARVFRVKPEDLLTPIEEIQERYARELGEELSEAVTQALVAGRRGTALLHDLHDLDDTDLDLAEFARHQSLHADTKAGVPPPTPKEERALNEFFGYMILADRDNWLRRPYPPPPAPYLRKK
jgi:hypothetical protein